MNVSIYGVVQEKLRDTENGIQNNDGKLKLCPQF